MTPEYICPVECTECPIEDCRPRELHKLIGFKQMTSRYDRGMTVIRVAETFNVSKHTVVSALDARAAGRLTSIPLVSIR